MRALNQLDREIALPVFNQGALDASLIAFVRRRQWHRRRERWGQAVTLRVPAPGGARAPLGHDESPSPL